MPLQITSQFDSGNIELLSTNHINDAQLAIRADGQSDFSQWFHFRATGIRHVACTFSIVNAGKTSYPRGWEGYSVATSHDRHHWYRTPAQFDGQTLSWCVESAYDALYFAYFAPYSLDQHANLVARSANATGVELECLGQTLDGRDLDCLHIGNNPDADPRPDLQSPRIQVWSIARQHPGETMAAWWMEGWLERLLDSNDASSRALRQIADIHVVPNMNPDGSFRGHLRTNAAGINLNREWHEPSLGRSPEVYWVRNCMHQTGVDLSLDVHGDEVLPYNFIAGTEGVVSWNSARNEQLVSFKRTLAALNPDFQTKMGYPITRPGNSNLTYCSNHIAQKFAALAMTLEMPFKDTANAPRADVGWSPERCRRLGRSCVEAVYLALTEQLITG